VSFTERGASSGLIHNGGEGASRVDIFNVNLVAMLIAGLAIVAVFVYVPVVSDFSFWFMLTAYLMLFHHGKK
jgi:hypothetical protein